MNATTINDEQKTKKTRCLIEEKMALLLKDSYYQPLNKSSNGAFFIDNIRFAVNIKILGQKLSIHPNSLNKDFRHHKIKCVHNIPLDKKSNLFDPKGWKIYQHSSNNFSLENVLNGNIQITSRWEKKVEKNAIKVKAKKDPKQKLNNDKNINEKITPANEKEENEKEESSHTMLIKMPNSKLICTGEFQYDDDDNYMDFFS